MVELVDTRVLRTLSPGYVGSSPTERTTHYLYQGGTFAVIYDPLTGKVNVSTYLSGKYKNEGRGYLQFKCQGKQIKVYRYAFYFMTGVWPSGLVDHKDECTLNNKWDNLRVISNTANQLRSSTKRQSNTSTYIGVYYQKNNKNWFYSMQINYKVHRMYGLKCPTRAAIERDKHILKNNIEAPLNILSTI